MNNFWTIACGAGLQDGLNPCIFMTCAVFIANGLWLSRRSLPVFWFRIIFVLVYALGDLIFNFGPAQIYIFHNNFIFFDKILYFVLGIWALISGILYFRRWFLLSRGLPLEGIVDGKIKFSFGLVFLAFLLTVLLAMVLSALATLWPINNYFMILGNDSMQFYGLHG